MDQGHAHLKISITAALPLLIAGCIAAPGSDTAREPSVEPAAASGAALSSPRGDTASATPSPLAELPSWRVYLQGKDGTGYPADPRPDVIDQLGQVVAIREGDERSPERWLFLSLALHWRMGDRYLEALMKAGRVTGTDLLMITADLLQKGERLPPLPHRARSQEDRTDWSPFPGFPGSPGSGGNDHTGGPGATSTGDHGTSAPAHRAPGRSPPWHGSVTPPGQPSPAAEDALHAHLNGVDSTDPAPRPSPFDAGYSPSRGERREPFKCEGAVYHGYKRACVDFQGTPDGPKWGRKLAGWAGRYFDPKNIGMTPSDRVNLCKVALAIGTFTACAAGSLACVGADVVTFGSVTVPCIWVTLLLCGGHGTVSGLLVDCPALVNAR